MEVSTEFLHQQERKLSVPLTPIQVAALLSVLRYMKHCEHAFAPVIVSVADDLYQRIETETGVSVHAEGMSACVEAWLSESSRG